MYCIKKKKKSSNGPLLYRLGCSTTLEHNCLESSKRIFESFEKCLLKLFFEMVFFFYVISMRKKIKGLENNEIRFFQSNEKNNIPVIGNIEFSSQRSKKSSRIILSCYKFAITIEQISQCRYGHLVLVLWNKSDFFFFFGG